MNNPVTHLLEWLKSQNQEIQSEIAFLISFTHPSFDQHNFGVDSGENVNQFYSRINEFSGTDIENVGFIVAFRAIFDFVIVNKRGSIKGWEGPKSMMESILNSVDPDLPPGMKEHAEKMLNDLPARRDLWISICQSWDELKRSKLSDDAIEFWENENLLIRGKERPEPIAVRATPI